MSGAHQTMTDLEKTTHSTLQTCSPHFLQCMLSMSILSMQPYHHHPFIYFIVKHGLHFIKAMAVQQGCKNT